MRSARSHSERDRRWRVGRGRTMRSVRLCAGALLRRRALGIVAVALLVGLGAGAVLAAAAGARRTSTAATRLYRRGAVADLEMDPASSSLSTETVAVRRLREIPSVRRATTAQFFVLAPPPRVHPNGQATA